MRERESAESRDFRLPTAGFLVVRSGEAHIRQYLSRTTKVIEKSGGAPPEGWETYHETFWESVGVDPTAYRGMGRMSLQPSDEYYYGDSEADWAGRVRLLEFVGDDDVQDYNGGLLATLEEANEVKLLLDTPSDWETIGVSQVASKRSRRTLGFDIGWWGEYYSLISDCIVAPTYHGPDEDDWPDVASPAKALNQHLLFDTVEDAFRFRDWYRTKSWAESEKPDNAEELRAKAAESFATSGAWPAWWPNIEDPFIVVRIDSVG